MKKAMGQTPEAERLRFLAQSCIRTTTAALLEAAKDMGYGTVGIEAIGRVGHCTIGGKIELDGEAMPKDFDWPIVEVRQISDEGKVSTVTTSFPKALSTLMRDTIEFGRPDWRKVYKTLNLKLFLAGGEARLEWTEGQCPHATKGDKIYSPNHSDLFMRKAPIAETETGAWYEIEGANEANAATKLSETAVGHFYQHKQESPARWFIHLELDGAKPIAGVTLAAQSMEGFDRSAWPHASHVTGHRNADVFNDRAEEIEILAKAANLVIEPNWQGKDITPAPAEPEDDPAGRILRTQMEQGWTNETLEMMGRRFIEKNGMSNAFADFLEAQAEEENAATLDEGPEFG